jgi:hypothetical protein
MTHSGIESEATAPGDTVAMNLGKSGFQQWCKCPPYHAVIRILMHRQTVILKDRVVSLTRWSMA